MILTPLSNSSGGTLFGVVATEPNQFSVVVRLCPPSTCLLAVDDTVVPRRLRRNWPYLWGPLTHIAKQAIRVCQWRKVLTLSPREVSLRCLFLVIMPAQKIAASVLAPLRQPSTRTLAPRNTREPGRHLPTPVPCVDNRVSAPEILSAVVELVAINVVHNNAISDMASHDDTVQRKIGVDTLSLSSARSIACGVQAPMEPERNAKVGNIDHRFSEGDPVSICEGKERRAAFDTIGVRGESSQPSRILRRDSGAQVTTQRAFRRNGAATVNAALIPVTLGVRHGVTPSKSFGGVAPRDVCSIAGAFTYLDYTKLPVVTGRMSA